MLKMNIEKKNWYNESQNQSLFYLLIKIPFMISHFRLEKFHKLLNLFLEFLFRFHLFYFADNFHNQNFKLEITVL